MIRERHKQYCRHRAQRNAGIFNAALATRSTLGRDEPRAWETGSGRRGRETVECVAEENNKWDLVETFRLKIFTKLRKNQDQALLP